jgi:NlpC/P60 family putative phage cell wall peptidase
MDLASSGADAPFAEELVARARRWIGTPYLHQASCRGVGSDCLGLLRGLWREVHGSEPEAVPAYTPDWAEPAAEDLLLAAASRHLLLLALAEAAPGDVLVFRIAAGRVAKHLGILAVAPERHSTFIHAYEGRGVVESPLTPAWSRRVAAAFRFPKGNA